MSPRQGDPTPPPSGDDQASRPGPRVAGARRRRNNPDRTGAAAVPSSPEASPTADRDVPLPHDFGRDGTSGLVTHDRALRAREVSRPRPEDDAEAVAGAEAMLRRLGRRR
ncbi:hypothetical protein [Raineyella fluvialis]|uniref:Uncharacterized protein n=1 Tax=Raineyella fluvialis TaxID=2662261 RepID=A0A5Q2FDI3_9ACTN|nr:hypothetical protein [Raineyella fluvialis]QGF22356.1 hypothetical protein Rai3103_00150 [Raineyella fluvialis]